MTVIIKELDHIPTSDNRAETTGRGASEGSERGASPVLQLEQMSFAMRREASRQARLWAD